MSNASHKTGFGVPPEETRFRKGQSGNPAGRPRGAKNNKTIMKALAQTVVSGAVPGQEGPPTLREAIIAKLFENAVKGDMKAINKFLERMDAYDAEDEGYSREAELAVMDRIRRLQVVAVMHAMTHYQGKDFELIAGFIKNVLAEFGKLEPEIRLMFDEDGKARRSVFDLDEIDLEDLAVKIATMAENAPQDAPRDEHEDAKEDAGLHTKRDGLQAAGEGA